MMWSAQWVDEVASTNDAVRGRGHGAVVVARCQTAGPGQRGNVWLSEEGKNLTFSVALEPTFLGAGEQFLLSEAVALAVADALGTFGLQAAVKWPNDIYIKDEKVAGILIENDIRGARLGRSVVGVGLNVNQMAFAAELPNPTSMALAAGREFAVEDVLAALLAALQLRYDALAAGFSPEADYAERLWRRGVEADFTAADGRFRGKVRGVLPTGELLIDTANGQRQFLFKEVEFL